MRTFFTNCPVLRMFSAQSLFAVGSRSLSPLGWISVRPFAYTAYAFGALFLAAVRRLRTLVTDTAAVGEIRVAATVISGKALPA